MKFFTKFKILGAASLIGLAALSLYGLANTEDATSTDRAVTAIKQQTPSLETALARKNLRLGDPIFLRIVKTKDGRTRGGYLEAFIENSQGEFVLFKTWDICTWSGQLGPKLRQGDKQSPEGFYFVTPWQMNPNSSYHLSFNLGYPNAYDRAHNRTGDFLMVHGNCVSIGCYAMTDKGIEEIYTLAQAAFEGGQPFFRVHIFPFPMRKHMLAGQSHNKNHAFWENLKQGWDMFEAGKRPPNVTVKHKTYIFASE